MPVQREDDRIDSIGVPFEGAEELAAARFPELTVLSALPLARVSSRGSNATL